MTYGQLRSLGYSDDALKRRTRKTLDFPPQSFEPEGRGATPGAPHLLNPWAARSQPKTHTIQTRKRALRGRNYAEAYPRERALPQRFDGVRFPYMVTFASTTFAT